MTVFQVVNPFTGESGCPVPLSSTDEIEEILVRAEVAWSSSAAATLDDRVSVVARIAGMHRDRRRDLAEIIVREMGKPLTEALGEVDFCAAIYAYYADNAKELLADELIETQSGVATVRKSPLGTILGVMPWNFPLYQIARFAAPNLILGNAVLVKPAPQCPASASALQQLIDEAGAPSGTYSTVLLSNEQTGTLIDDPRIRGVSLTGSERAGRAIGSRAGANMKKVVLELGGSDPFILLSTDDMARTVAAAVYARVGNNGQVCNGAKRFIIVEELYEEFASRLTEALRSIVPGNPMAEGTVVGPLASIAAAQNLASQVSRAVVAGASLRIGTGVNNGAFFAPTVMENVDPLNPAYREEFFGPVAQLYKVADENEAVTVANATPFGLGSYIYSVDAAQAERIASRLEVGMVFVNEVGSEAPELPFGGIKNSGTGRELGARGVEEFMNRKVIKRA
ncbi:NAD-dependent succinate-semialdehyde dehydrogenase [Microbacterium sp. zg.B48]|uniref:NAD-dependent succinate-semialdehyde dehydrogenase n=1 Tax=Microbacterium sp. zg.B48 TaxID=2969408 RepID=UPI00214ACCBA|nr:NAD-dependent succinate-semialdehyde dehydrogenase [Microbacterium sp. zg.B48]MCR2762482.1 NAD-dependent succinate-semialdehyde dehydrogenase [Microbacterium sp. zg.B48]